MTGTPAESRARRATMPVAELRLSDRNPRTISTSRFQNLKRSLEQDRAFLDARPLLVNSYPGRENIVIAGVPERVVMEILGHSTLAMVKRYQHVLPGLTIAAAERMDRVMGR